MPPGFLALIAAQFVSGLADNALLIVTLARLAEQDAPLWLAPLIKLGFTLAFVLLAPVVGAAADARPKRTIMFAGNALKAAGCGWMAIGGDPLAAFSVAGLGAALYSPAKYGLVTELVPARQLVAANAWIEVCTVGAVLLGTAAGGALVSPLLRTAAAWTLPLQAGGAPTYLGLALAAVFALYALAAALNLTVPLSGVARVARRPQLPTLLPRFLADCRTLWRDRAGRLSLTVTTLFWGVGAVLQLMVLRWSEEALGLGLHQGAMLQMLTAVGIVAGATLAGKRVPLAQAERVLPLGIAMGLLVPCLSAVQGAATGAPLLLLVGACAGYFLVPMNALLQHRGHVLLSAGRSIAVQNFAENLGVVALLAAYAALGAAEVSLTGLMWALGLLVAAVMGALLAQRRLAFATTRRASKDAA